MAFKPYCSLPELEGAMGVWEFMEQIHSRSYTYIIKNVYSDPSEVFDTILDDQRILARAKSVTQAYDDFINAAQEYGSSNSWKHAQEGVATAQSSLYELKRKLYRAVANVNILEGIRFYVSFACSFAFGELKLMEGSAKIISLRSIIGRRAQRSPYNNHSRSFPAFTGRIHHRLARHSRVWITAC